MKPFKPNLTLADLPVDSDNKEVRSYQEIFKKEYCSSSIEKKNKSKPVKTLLTIKLCLLLDIGTFEPQVLLKY